MPQIFKMGEYYIYFWTNENDPLEPIHVHVAKGSPSANATKIWITSSGNCLLCNSDTPTRVLANWRGFLRHGRTPQRAITSPLHPVTSLPLSRLFCGYLF